MAFSAARDNDAGRPTPPFVWARPWQARLFSLCCPRVLQHVSAGRERKTAPPPPPTTTRNQEGTANIQWRMRAASLYGWPKALSKGGGGGGALCRAHADEVVTVRSHWPRRATPCHALSTTPRQGAMHPLPLHNSAPHDGDAPPTRSTVSRVHSGRCGWTREGPPRPSSAPPRCLQRVEAAIIPVDHPHHRAGRWKGAPPCSRGGGGSASLRAAGV